MRHTLLGNVIMELQVQNKGCSFVTRVEVPKEYINGNPFEINSLEALVKSGRSVSTKQHCP